MYNKAQYLFVGFIVGLLTVILINLIHLTPLPSFASTGINFILSTMVTVYASTRVLTI